MRMLEYSKGVTEAETAGERAKRDRTQPGLCVCVFTPPAIVHLIQLIIERIDLSPNAATFILSLSPSLPSFLSLHPFALSFTFTSPLVPSLSLSFTATHTHSLTQSLFSPFILASTTAVYRLLPFHWCNSRYL